MSDKEKTLISHLLYFTGIVNNESVLVDYDYLKSLLKQYKDKDCLLYTSTVPESIIAFLESTDYESAIRLTISLGGDADTMGVSLVE